MIIMKVVSSFYYWDCPYYCYTYTTTTTTTTSLGELHNDTVTLRTRDNLEHRLHKKKQKPKRHGWPDRILVLHSRRNNNKRAVEHWGRAGVAASGLATSILILGLV